MSIRLSDHITHERGNMYDPNAMAGKIMLPGTLVASIVGHYQRKYLATHDTLLIMVLP